MSSAYWTLKETMEYFNMKPGTFYRAVRPHLIVRNFNGCKRVEVASVRRFEKLACSNGSNPEPASVRDKSNIV